MLLGGRAKSSGIESWRLLGRNLDVEQGSSCEGYWTCEDELPMAQEGLWGIAALESKLNSWAATPDSLWDWMKGGENCEGSLGVIAAVEIAELQPTLLKLWVGSCMISLS